MNDIRDLVGATVVITSFGLVMFSAKVEVGEVLLYSDRYNIVGKDGTEIEFPAVNTTIRFDDPENIRIDFANGDGIEIGIVKNSN